MTHVRVHLAQSFAEGLCYSGVLFSTIACNLCCVVSKKLDYTYCIISVVLRDAYLGCTL